MTGDGDLHPFCRGCCLRGFHRNKLAGDPERRGPVVIWVAILACELVHLGAIVMP